MTPTGTAAAPRSAVLRRRISPLRVLLSVVLILGLGLAGAVVADRIDTRRPALVTAQAIAAGQIISEADITVVRVAADAAVATVAETERASVLGRAAAVPLVAGTLLSPAHLGAAAWPPAGQAVIGVAVKAGRMPSGITAGSQVTVMVVPTSNPGSGGAGQVVQARATVVSIEPASDQSGDAAVSLLISAADATRIASVAGEVTLLQLGIGG